MADEILQTDITHESVRSMTQGQVEELGESARANFLDQSAELALDMVPILPAIMITVTEGRAVISGSATLQMSLIRGAKRLGRATAYNALGMGLSALIGPAAMPTVMGVRIAEQRFGHQMAMGELLRSKTEEVVALTGQTSPADGLRLNTERLLTIVNHQHWRRLLLRFRFQCHRRVWLPSKSIGSNSHHQLKPGTAFSQLRPT